jgi:hypothetical protein
MCLRVLYQNLLDNITTLLGPHQVKFTLFECNKLFSSFTQSVIDYLHMMNTNSNHYTESTLYQYVNNKYSTKNTKSFALSLVSSFSLPSELWFRDLQKLQEYNYDWSAFILSYRLPNTFNSNSCDSIFLNTPDYQILHEFATFTPDPDVSHIERNDKHLHPLFWKHAYKLFLKNRAIFLPLHIVRKLDLPNLHFSPLHWTTKVDDDLGRLLFDCSNRSYGRNLNSPEALIAAKEYYGELTHPSIITIVNDWFDFLSLHGYTWNECRLYKNDVQSAFQQLYFDPSAVPFLASMITDDLVMFHTVGVFGISEMPVVWALQGRNMLSALKPSITGSLHLYVDDFMRLSHHSTARIDQSHVANILTTVFNNTDANSREKTNSTYNTL